MVSLIAFFILMKSAHASVTDVFVKPHAVYQMSFSASLMTTKKNDRDQYLKLAEQQAGYLVGSMAIERKVPNRNFTGGPLYQKGDITLDEVIEHDDGRVGVFYRYHGKVVIDEAGLKAYEVYLPIDIESISSIDRELIYYCTNRWDRSYDPAALPFTWNPFASKKCGISYQAIKTSLSEVRDVRSETYPEYPRMVRDGVIRIAYLVGKMDPRSDHEIARGQQMDPSKVEYSEVIGHLKKNGFQKSEKETRLPVLIDSQSDQYTSLRETWVKSAGSIRIEVNMIFGNSVFSIPEQKLSFDDFQKQLESLAPKSSVLIYSGHSGFQMDNAVAQFDGYQLIAMNGCQTSASADSFFRKKSSQNLDLIVNVRQTRANVLVMTSTMDAIVDWTEKGIWTPYSVLIRKMDMVESMLGVLGDEDNTSKP